MTHGSRRQRSVALVLCLALALFALGSLCIGAGSRIAPLDALRAVGSLLHLGAPLADPTAQSIVELRFWRVVVTASVGAALALSGGYIQGVFQNGLASPSLIGVTGGAALGASLAVLVIGGYAPRLVLEHFTQGALLIPAFAFAGAMGTAWLVMLLASGGARTSVTALLLTGIAVNMCVAGAFAAIQSLTLNNWEVSRALLAWTFGTLDDRASYHAWIVLGGLALSAAMIPFTAVELDLLKGGEADAAALGVDLGRLKWRALFGASLSSACAVAVAGQIAFVGLVVPHLVRMLSGAGHRRLLPECILAGGVFLVGAEFLQRWWLGDSSLQPGVVMSLVGGPFFLVLLVRERRTVSAW